MTDKIEIQRSEIRVGDTIRTEADRPMMGQYGNGIASEWIATADTLGRFQDRPAADGVKFFLLHRPAEPQFGGLLDAEGVVRFGYFKATTEPGVYTEFGAKHHHDDATINTWYRVQGFEPATPVQNYVLNALISARETSLNAEAGNDTAGALRVLLNAVRMFERNVKESE